MQNEMDHKTMQRCMQSSLDLIRLLNVSDYTLVDGILSDGQITLIFETEQISAKQPQRCNIKMVIHNNHWKVETVIH